MRPPLTDASSRVNNCLTPITEGARQGQYIISPDPMSIVDSPISMKESVARYCISPVFDSRAGSKRNSAVSAGSIVSGKGKRKTHVGPWQLGRTLGSGATGRVRLAKHAVTGQTAAIKIVSKSTAIPPSASIAAMDKNAKNFVRTGTHQMPSGIEREVVIMKLIEHPNVISLYDVWENRGELYLVLEYVEGGELFEYVKNYGPLPEEEAVRLFRQIIAGLGYCHRFNICHRDLKPENILLDAEGNVKLADFGMAALQPDGHWLNTSCGSPHYAAPEIIYGRKYHGDTADIWSCGIILYALLTGFLPFDGGDVQSTLQLVRKADYIIPPEVSKAAADLIGRILKKKPEERISMEKIWEHPLLRKYERSHQVRSKHYLGPAPPLSAEDCGMPVMNQQDIDIDILRNLQTLWYGARPEQLIDKLLSSEPTQERLFYNALVKFRNEQLENYQGQPLEYSASDYHHISRGQGRLSKHVRNRPQGDFRRRFQFTQFPAVKETGKRKALIKEPNSSGTVESYDPFRSPMSQVPEKQPQYTRITIHRNALRGHQGSERPHVSNHFEDDNSDPIGNKHSSSFTIVRNKKPKGGSVNSYQSKASPLGSRRVLNGATTPRSASYKRNVCFRHARNRSQRSISSKAKKSPGTVTATRRQPSSDSLSSALDSTFSGLENSPSLPARPVVVRGSGITIKNCSQPRRVLNCDIIWRDEARKVSHELSQICEKAFNGSSSSAGCTDSTCIEPETPPTSISIASLENSNHNIGRPTPDVCSAPQAPDGSLNPSHTGVELAGIRRLIEHSNQNGARHLQSSVVTVIGHLDRLIEQDKERQRQTHFKAEESTVPINELFPNIFNESSALPSIPERSNDLSRKLLPGDPKRDNDPQVSHSSAESHPSHVSREGKRLIRMVPPSSLQSFENPKTLTSRKSYNEAVVVSSLDFDTDWEVSTGGVPVDARHGRVPCELNSLEEGLGSPKPKGSRTSDYRKWSWFRKSQTSSESVERVVPKVDDLVPGSTPAVVLEAQHTQKTPISGQKALPQLPKVSAGVQKVGFLRQFMKKKVKKNKHDIAPTPDCTARSRFLEKEIPVESETLRGPRSPQLEGKTENWLARVFQFKPVTKVVALNTSTTNALRDIYKMLRGLRYYGVEEVRLDKANRVIYGRIGHANFLRLRPVEFTAEFYTVIEDRRQANLSLVRFKQERGAASSFNKVVDLICLVMQRHDLLIEDPVRAKKMIQVLDAFP